MKGKLISQSLGWLALVIVGASFMSYVVVKSPLINQKQVKIPVKKIEQTIIMRDAKPVVVRSDTDQRALYQLLEKIPLTQLWANNRPSGWSYDVLLMDHKDQEVISLKFVGNALKLGDQWYDVGDEFILSIRKYYDKASH